MNPLSILVHNMFSIPEGSKLVLKSFALSWAVIPALWRQRQVDFLVQGHPGLQSEFQDSQGYTAKTCLPKKSTTTKKKKKKRKRKKEF